MRSIFNIFFFSKTENFDKKICDTPERLIWCCLTIILGINFYLYLNIAILAFVVTVRYTFHEFIAFKIFLLIIFSCYDQVCGLSITSPFSLFLPGNTRIGDLLDNYALPFLFTSQYTDQSANFISAYLG